MISKISFKTNIWWVYEENDSLFVLLLNTYIQVFLTSQNYSGRIK